MTKRKTITSLAHGVDEDEVFCLVLLHCITLEFCVFEMVVFKNLIYISLAFFILLIEPEQHIEIVCQKAVNLNN